MEGRGWESRQGRKVTARLRRALGTHGVAPLWKEYMWVLGSQEQGSSPSVGKPGVEGGGKCLSLGSCGEGLGLESVLGAGSFREPGKDQRSPKAEIPLEILRLVEVPGAWGQNSGPSPNSRQQALP